MKASVGRKENKISSREGTDCKPTVSVLCQPFSVNVHYDWHLVGWFCFIACATLHADNVRRRIWLLLVLFDMLNRRSPTAWIHIQLNNRFHIGHEKPTVVYRRARKLCFQSRWRSWAAAMLSASCFRLPLRSMCPKTPFRRRRCFEESHPWLIRTFPTCLASGWRNESAMNDVE